MSKVVAVVVVHNGVKWLSNCFESLISSEVPLHIIAIDNKSSDGSSEYIGKTFPDVELICLNKNYGFGQANNIGLRKALELDASQIFLMNQDAWINSNTIKELISVSNNYPQYGILSPLHLSSKELSFEKQFLKFVSDQNTENFINDCFFGKLKPVYTTQYIHAAAWLIKRDCLNMVGGFDSLFDHYGEDDDYINRAKYFGFQLGIVTKASFVHDTNYKNWEMIEWDANRNQIISYLMLKKMAPHFRSNLLVFLKSTFDELTTLLLFRKWKKFVFKLRIFCNVFIKLNLIYRSYKTSFKQGGFL